MGQSSLAKISDEVERTKNRLAGLTGSTQGGALAYDALKAAAKSSGVELTTLEGAFEKAKIGLDTFADKHIVYANDAISAAKANAQLSDSLGTVGKMLQGNLANAAEEKNALGALTTSFETTGTLGVAAFRKIQAESPSTALAISRAFGYDKVSEFITELGVTSSLIAMPVPFPPSGYVVCGLQDLDNLRCVHAVTHQRDANWLKRFEHSAIRVEHGGM